jgi:hypothetical protein
MGYSPAGKEVIEIETNLQMGRLVTRPVDGPVKRDKSLSRLFVPTPVIRASAPVAAYDADGVSSVCSDDLASGAADSVGASGGLIRAWISKS